MRGNRIDERAGHRWPCSQMHHCIGLGHHGVDVVVSQYRTLVESDWHVEQVLQSTGGQVVEDRDPFDE